MQQKVTLPTVAVGRFEDSAAESESSRGRVDPAVGPESTHGASSPAVGSDSTRRPVRTNRGRRDELERQAETLRRLADQLEALAEQRRASGNSIGAAEIRRERDLLARAAARLPVDDAEALLDLPVRLRGAVRRVRLSAELLSHHLGTMSELLRKAAR